MPDDSLRTLFTCVAYLLVHLELLRSPSALHGEEDAIRVKKSSLTSGWGFPKGGMKVTRVAKNLISAIIFAACTPGNI